jgi:ElaB/YqjD/DUF883 family membrane-anchored ribosome-binding protein
MDNNTNTDHSKDFAHSTPRAARDIAHAAAEAVESIAQPIVEGASEVKQRAQVIGRTRGKAVKEQVNRVNRGARKAYRSIKQSGEEFENLAQNAIRRTPITTVLFAVGIGASLGFVLGRASVPRGSRR